MTRFLRILMLFCGVVAFAPTPASADDAAPVILTVTGDIGKTNRPASDPFRDPFFAAYDIEFERAFAWTRPMLLALPQVTVTARFEDWPEAVTARGPRLRDVLVTVDVSPDATITLHALDDYTKELTADERKATDWVLALNMGDRPLGLGGRGPLWLLNDTGDRVASFDEESKWIWSVFAISVGNGE